MINFDYIRKILSEIQNITPSADDIAAHICANTVFVGRDVWVVTKLTCDKEYHVIPTRVTSVQMGKHDKISFSVEGSCNKNGYNHRYQATFSFNSINKTVFLNPDAANQALIKLN